MSGGWIGWLWWSRLAREVYAREQQLKQQLQQLHIEIDEAKRQQVKEIVDTDFFADLQAKAQNIRRRWEHGPRGWVEFQFGGFLSIMSLR